MTRLRFRMRSLIPSLRASRLSSSACSSSITAETEPGDPANGMQLVASSAAMSIDYQQEYKGTQQPRDRSSNPGMSRQLRSMVASFLSRGMYRGTRADQDPAMSLRVLSRAFMVRIFELQFRIAGSRRYVWYPDHTDSHKKLAITYENPLPHEFFSIKCCKARRYPRLQDSSLPLFRTTTYSPLFTGISSLIFRALTIADR